LGGKNITCAVRINKNFMDKQVQEKQCNKVERKKKFKFSTVMLCRAGVIAALYAVLTWAMGDLAFGPIQIRPAEALTILPLFFVEAVPGLYVGCMLANLMSGYGVYDIFVGSLATLLAAGLTFGAGKLIKNDIIKVIVGGFFPIICNAFIIPAVFILAGAEDIAYWAEFGIMAATEAIWVYVIGVPLFFAIRALQKKNVRVMQSYSAYKCDKIDKNVQNNNKKAADVQ
jgi:uncharacterized membrane protein